MTIVTRFPPSPTGFMHIGTARTLLYNWLYARKHGGKVVFRIEDTDRARYDAKHVDALVNGVKWLELDYDGEVISQFERRERHAEVANELLKNGKAYHCYCSPQELDEMREKAKAEGRSAFYDRRWRDSTATPPPGVKPVVRIKAPLEGESIVRDHVQGEVHVANSQLDDFIILRSDGTPTYLHAVVVDDHDMGVTHVIRGDDHLSNTPRQNIVYDAMGWKQPEYAHIPLILGPDGSKMSKRHGAASVEEYREMGYLPEAMRNYLLRLGWSHGDDELISDKQAKEWFNLEHVQKSPARFDFVKLESVNAHYMKQADGKRLIELAKPFYKSRHDLEINAIAEKRILAGIEELKSRAKTLLQFADESAFYARTIPFNYDDKAKAQLNDAGKAILKEIADKMSALNDFTSDRIQTLCKSIADAHAAGKLGQVAMPLRAALTGTTVSPSVFHAAEILGKDETLARINHALKA